MMIKVTLVQKDKYGDECVEAPVEDFNGAESIAALLKLKDEDIEIVFHLAPTREACDDQV